MPHISPFHDISMLISLENDKEAHTNLEIHNSLE